MAEYPSRWESDAALADGGTIHLRPIASDDGPRLVALNERTSEESLYMRFHSTPPKLTSERLAYFVNVDYAERMALVATVGEDVVAVARYDRTPGTAEAEVAFLVSDAHQGRGIGTLLLEHLAAAAREQGIERFHADVLANNRRMLGVFRDAGWEVESHIEAGGVVEVTFAISDTAAARSARWEREHVAEAESIRRLLSPRSIAVVGASRRPGTIGHEVLLNLVRSEYRGAVYPVNPNAHNIAGLPAVASVLDVSGPLDLGVIVVPAEHVLAAVDDCGKKGAAGVVVISAGFSEAGEAGEDVERGLVETARSHGMRLVGPNCMGILNTAPDVRMNATFAPVAPFSGPVGFLSQSGAFGIALLEWAHRLQLGVSSFLSVGNKADVSGNDLLQYWEDDERTSVILLYLESFGNPRKFARLARRVSHRKPIVAVKSGRTGAGARAAASHTAAAATPDVAVDALFRQTGVIRVDTVDEMFDTAQLLAFQPLPPGRRVAIIGNGGGPGILAADACTQSGLDVPELALETQEGLRRLLPLGAGVANPVDLVASASPEAFEAALDLVLDDPAVDAVVVQFTPPLVTSGDDVAEAIAGTMRRKQGNGGAGKPVVTVFLAREGIPPAARSRESGGVDLPVYHSPERAVRALAHAVGYAEWRARPEGSIPDFELHRDDARQRVAAFMAGHPEGGWLAPADAVALLRVYGIPVAETVPAMAADEAATSAERLGFPVVLKTGDPELVHKTDTGGVVVGLATADAVRAAFPSVASAGRPERGVVVQPMAQGTETIIGVVQDPAFGPLVMFGLGGVTMELLDDRAFRIVPITDLDARELVRAIRGAPLLFGYRGSEPVDVAALEETIVRVGLLAAEVPELAELDLNPVMVSTGGVVAVDAKVRLAPPPHAQPAVRRLRSPRKVT